jgi:hypothetical protein
MSWWTEMDWSVTPVSALLAQVADKTGLSRALSRELAALQKRAGSRDRGRVIRDLAVMLADGGDCVTDLGAVRDQAVLCLADG